jgi:sugar O-acyltransferase (sialic acid O-acetyltransferase NeuD family)
VASYPVAVLGFHDGSAGQVAGWFEEASGHRIACFVHPSAERLVVDAAAENARRVTTRTEYPADGMFRGRPLINSAEWIDEIMKLGIRHVLPLTAINRDRLAQIELCRERGLELVSAIHPTVTILPGGTVEPGAWISAGCLIGYKAEVRAGVIINTRSQVDHHDVLEECCQLDPGVVAAGNVTFRRCSHVHTGATIINRVEIGEDAVVGAGSAVLRDVPPRTTVVGIPARVILRHAGGA